MTPTSQLQTMLEDTQRKLGVILKSSLQPKVSSRMRQVLQARRSRLLQHKAYLEQQIRAQEQHELADAGEQDAHDEQDETES